jgi:hypothetical protein
MRSAARLLVACVLLATLSPAFADEAPPAIDWGAGRVRTSEIWPTAILLGGKDALKPGLTLRLASDEYASIVGTFATRFPIEATCVVERFGRRGNDVLLLMRLRPTGGTLPEHVAEHLRTNSHHRPVPTPLTNDDARELGVDGRAVQFSAPLPRDLPPGDYRLVAELRDEADSVLETLTRAYVRRDLSGPSPLQTLDDEALIQELLRIADRLHGTLDPNEGSYRPDRVPDADPEDREAFRLAGEEIVRRGARMLPLLRPLLQRDPPLVGPASRWPRHVFSLSTSLVELLRRIDDPAATQLLVDVVEGLDGAATLPARRLALHGLESRTHIGFYASKHDVGFGPPLAADAVRVSAVPREEEDHAAFVQVADRYREWLAGEGRDPARWLDLADARAHAGLDPGDRVQFMRSIRFLTRAGRPDLPRDPQPQKAVSVLARLLEQNPTNPLNLSPFEPQPDLHATLASYGPLARAHARLILDHDRRKRDEWSLSAVGTLGGNEAVAYLFDQLPELRAGLQRRGIADPLAVEERELPEVDRDLLDRYLACRWAIDRNIARVFASDDELLAWWATAQKQSPRQWVEQNLAITAADADAGHPRAQWILRQLLPDLPHADRDTPLAAAPNAVIWPGPPPFFERPPPPFRVAWLAAHRDRLRLAPDE